VVFDVDGEVTFVVFDVDGEVTFVVFDVDGGGADGGGGGGHGDGIRFHALGGPSVDDVPSNRAYVVSHAVVPLNMSSMFVTELVFHPEMSALNSDAPPNIYHMSVTELVFHPEMSALNADAP
jgi:hypothetical protein